MVFAAKFFFLSLPDGLPLHVTGFDLGPQHVLVHGYFMHSFVHSLKITISKWQCRLLPWMHTYSIQLQLSLLQRLDLVSVSVEMISKTLHIQLDDVIIHHLILNRSMILFIITISLGIMIIIANDLLRESDFFQLSLSSVNVQVHLI